MSDETEPLVPPCPTAGKPYALVALLQVHWFIRLRWMFAAGTLAALAIERFLLPGVQRPWPLLALVLGIGLTNVLWTIASRLLRRQIVEPDADQRLAIRSGQIFVSAQIACDLLLLTGILAFTGGIENPMSLFYLFHIAISGLLLRTWQAAIQSAWAVLLYAGMAAAQCAGWWPHYALLPHLGPAGLHDQPQHVALVVAVVALAVFGTLYFTDRIGKVLDRRQDMLIEMNTALERSRQAIQELQRRRSRFMQTAAHQLKSPLAMVQTLANLIRDGIVTDMPAILGTCDKIIRRCRDGIAQVGELLALARVQEADPRRHRTSLADVGQIVAELCGRHASVAAERHITLDWTVPAGPVLRARVHPADLADCVDNLVENAIKYTANGGRVRVIVLRGRAPTGNGMPLGPEVRLGVSTRREAGATAEGEQASREFVYIVVRDTGMGLGEPLVIRQTPPAGSIFDAFRRGNTALAAGIPGTGLGLSIVREIVEQAGGAIHVCSRPGAGSNFTVCFPGE